MHKISLTTHHREEILDITPLIHEFLDEQAIAQGILLIYSPHTTAAISVNENYDPDVKRDINHYLKKTIPSNFGFVHAEGNSDAHIKGSLVNFSQMFIIDEHQLQLGRWQGIYFMEFDGPRQREIWLQIIES